MTADRGVREYVQFMMGPYLRRRRFEGWTDPKLDTREDVPRLTGR